MPPNTGGTLNVQDVRSSLRQKIYHRQASLTEVEKVFLHGLLVDSPTKNQQNEETLPLVQATKVLNDEILFSIPNSLSPPKKPVLKKRPHDYRFLVGLWQAHEDGVSPKKLSELQKSIETKPLLPKPTESQDDRQDDNEDVESIRSDQEVRPDYEADDGSDSSWKDEEGCPDHFDAWQVLKDEYASDFGFDYAPDGTFQDDENQMEYNVFQVLGTSADDVAAHPHVLSPPLMDAIINFVPDRLQGQNMWLKYSLVRDGACLETFKRYARASRDTILAIETTKGQVFGSYTSTPWRTTYSFFGGAPSFVWKMRNNRNTVCHSLIEQAEMEGEIDVYFLLGDGQRPQCCTSHRIGIGEGSIHSYNKDGSLRESAEESETKKGKSYGFAFALEDDLLSGTSSKCSSYKNPCFVDSESRGEPFQVLNLELWTFTPCFSLDSAEKLEMTQFFVSESIHNSSISSNASSNPFSSNELSQTEFYRRVGQNDEHEELRERWQYRNMMDGGMGSGSSILKTPHFNNSDAGSGR